MIPIRSDYRRKHTPWMNYALIASNVLLFLYGYHGATPEGLQRIDAMMLQPQGLQLHQFFSCVFLHAGWEHLLGNMIFLWVFGNAINDKFGSVGYLAFYLAGGIVASAGYLLLSGNAPCLGASGAISAVSGAYLVLLPRTRITVLIFFIFITFTEISAMFFILLHLVIDAFMTFQGMAGQASGGVAYAAHLSGYVFGILVASLLLAVRLLPRDAYDLFHHLRDARRRAKYQRLVSKGYDPFSAQRSRRRPSVKSAVPTAEQSLRSQISQAAAEGDLPAAARMYGQLAQDGNPPVLPLQRLLDVANQLMSGQRHAEAASAYECFVENYGNYENIGDVYLLLGLLYARYLHLPQQARQRLNEALETLVEPSKRDLVKDLLQSLRE